MWKFGQEIIKVIVGKCIYGVVVVLGGNYKIFMFEECWFFLDGKVIFLVDIMIEWIQEILQMFW